MRALRFIQTCLALAGLTATGAVWGQTFPAVIPFDGNFTLPSVSGVFTPMRLTTGDVAWSGTGTAGISFTMSQRGTVWLAVYRKGDNRTGERGPNGAWLRLEPQDLFVYVSAGQSFEAGTNTINWNGRDWEGNAAGAGAYEFDLIAINNLDKPVLAGPGSREFGHTLIDTRYSPPEIWGHETDRDNPTWGGRSGDIVRGTLGTDYLANPNAWERWSYNDVTPFEGARTLGGFKFDDQSKEVFWATHHSGENGGIYKMLINRSAKTWEKDTSFGDNGLSRNRTDRIVGIQPYKNVIYDAHWGREAVPFCAVEVRDKVSGEILKEYDVTEFYTQERVGTDGSVTVVGVGPGQITVNESGVWVTSWSQPNITHLDLDGNILWVNRNGDIIGDTVSEEAAAELGITAASGNPMQIGADHTGNVALFTISGNNRGSHFSALGRDGTGLFEVAFSSSLGPFRPDATWHLTLLDQGQPYDGIYYTSYISLVSPGEPTPDGARPGPAMLLYIPYDLASGKLGDNATAVAELESAGSPEAYALGDAYPNPFNPETTIEFAVPAPEPTLVTVDVYNAAGQQVATLVNEMLAAGTYRTRWDGRDQNGAAVASGAYLYRMQAGSFTESRTMSLLK